MVGTLGCRERGAGAGAGGLELGDVVDVDAAAEAVDEPGAVEGLEGAVGGLAGGAGEVAEVGLGDVEGDHGGVGGLDSGELEQVDEQGDDAIDGAVADLAGKAAFGPLALTVELVEEGGGGLWVCEDEVEECGAVDGGDVEIDAGGRKCELGSVAGEVEAADEVSGDDDAVDGGGACGAAVGELAGAGEDQK